MKGKRVWIGIAALAAVLGWNVYQRQGVQILRQESLQEIVYVRDYRQGYEDMTDVTERVDGERLARLLETYKRRRGGTPITSVWMGDVQVDMYIRTIDGPYEVILGNENRVSDGKKQYEIFDSGALLAEILEMIDK